MVVVVGAGYAGISVAEKLREKGVEAKVYDMRGKGGELAEFAKIDELKEYYAKYIEKVDESEVEVIKGCVVSTNPFKVISPQGLEVKKEDGFFICTGAVDLTPAASEIYGKRVAGIYTLETAIRLLAMGKRIGNKVLVVARKEEDILKPLERYLVEKDFEVEVLLSKEPAEVYGSRRVERVEIGGESVSCDALVVYGGRIPFNPKNLKGKLAGNVVECTYDYEKVEKNVQSIMF
ncbi:MAG: NAD(P)/FAD-dependent oxidoreductase [Archaeoglobus sp.]|uniref:NAD(P)/FAD-dependent oxidoreductase n=1 Tax=Archaeoglobus sp. TaxID=1872626 RepID=UPI001D35C6F5|nr:FAD/NAD(P)-binding oxidoreductase [Archaeoglobus sp.]MBO8179075.1 NAD(P)/FAD-dependent oxidoreductase [Archaeoglobus sp.]